MGSTVRGPDAYPLGDAGGNGSGGEGAYPGGSAVPGRRGDAAPSGSVASAAESAEGSSSTGGRRSDEGSEREAVMDQDERIVAERSEATILSSVASPTRPPPPAPAEIDRPLPSPTAGLGSPPARPRATVTTAGQPAPQPRRKRTGPAAHDLHTPQERLLLLDTWQRSGLPASDFGAMVGLSKFTLYAWKARFDKSGPEGLIDQPRGGPRGSKLAEITKRTILMLKAAHPEWGCRRISDMLLRGPALPASESAVARVLHEAGYQLSEEVTEPHPDKVRRFERAKPNQLWQSDLFTFILKRQNRRVYLVAFMDDHSRFIVSYGLHASQSGALVLEVLRAGIASYGSPAEILTDNGSQYVTWRGRSAFSKELQKLGIGHVVAKPRRPQTLGKVERFWGTLWRECLLNAVFVDLDEARKRIGLFVDHYNFQRPHQGIEGLVPADRFFGAAPEVLKALQDRVAANSLDLARNGVPKPPFYMTGQVGGKSFAVHAEGEKVILTSPGADRQEVQLTPPSGTADLADPQVQLTGEPVPPAQLPEPIAPQGIVPWQLPSEEDQEEPAPGTSAIDDLDKRMARLSAMTGPGKESNSLVDDVGETDDDALAEGGLS